MKRNQDPILEALTEEARRAIEGPRLYLNVIPFRLGREERKKDRKGWLKKPRFLKGKPNNDFYMLDNRNYREISREHFLIQYNGEGFVLKDRGSHCGTLVNSALYAQTAASVTCPLQSGDIIVVGSTESPYKFKFLQLES